MLNRQVGRPHDDERDDDDDADVDAVDEKHTHDLAGIPAAGADVEARQRQRHADDRGNAVGENCQRIHEPPGARVHGRAVLDADHVERIDRTADDRPQHTDAKRREAESQNGDGSDRDASVEHQRR